MITLFIIEYKYNRWSCYMKNMKLFLSVISMIGLFFDVKTNDFVKMFNSTIDPRNGSQLHVMARGCNDEDFAHFITGAFFNKEFREKIQFPLMSKKDIDGKTAAQVAKSNSTTEGDECDILYHTLEWLEKAQSQKK